MIKVDDLEPPILDFYCLSRCGNPFEVIDHKARYRLVVAVFRQVETKQLRHFIDRHPTRKKPRSVVPQHRLIL